MEGAIEWARDLRWVVSVDVDGRTSYTPQKTVNCAMWGRAHQKDACFDATSPALSTVKGLRGTVLQEIHLASHATH